MTLLQLLGLCVFLAISDTCIFQIIMSCQQSVLKFLCLNEAFNWNRFNLSVLYTITVRTYKILKSFAWSGAG